MLRFLFPTETNNQLNEISLIEAFVADYSHLNKEIAAYSFWNVLNVNCSPLVKILTSFFECLELYPLFTETMKDDKVREYTFVILVA